MKGISDKLRFIFIPFVIIAIGFILAYTFLHWLLFIKAGIPLKEEIVNFWLPFALLWIPIVIWLGPRIKLLRFNNGKIHFIYQIIAFFVIFIPTLVAQEYIVKATGKLTELNSITELNHFPPTKYYTLKSYFINKKTIGVHSSFDEGGRYNQHFNMHIYVVMPIFAKEEDASTKEPLAWLGVLYYKSISNRLGENEKMAEYQKFINESQKKFDNKNISEFIYLDRIDNSEVRDGYIEAIKNNPIYKPNQTIFVGVNKPFPARNDDDLALICVGLFIGSLIFLIAVLIPKIDEEQVERIKAGKPDEAAQREMREFFDFFKPKNGYYITPILTYINIGIFLLMAIMGSGVAFVQGQDLINWGANYGPLTKNGEWWRLLTSIFLHGGLLHIMANICGLIVVGFFLEPFLGPKKYLTVYLLTGILASAVSLSWYDATISIGASGAIFGLYGISLALLLTKVYRTDFTLAFLIGVAIFIGFNLLWGPMGKIDNAAHIGGFLSGFAIGLILSPRLKRQKENAAACPILGEPPAHQRKSATVARKRQTARVDKDNDGN